MTTYIFLLLGLISTFGCARVRVEAPKEAIKLDVSMRLDIYQHIEKDIDRIEDIVTGVDKASNKGDRSFLQLLVSNAYAQEGGLSPEIEQAVFGRRSRRSELVTFEARGIIGENSMGLVEVRGEGGRADVLVEPENQDRMAIYQSVANKNGSSVGDVQRIYAKRLQDDAPPGTPIEGPSGWTIK